MYKILLSCAEKQIKRLSTTMVSLTRRLQTIKDGEGNHIKYVLARGVVHTTGLFQGQNSIKKGKV
jgi:hypothetical protein